VKDGCVTIPSAPGWGVEIIRPGCAVRYRAADTRVGHLHSRMPAPPNLLILMPTADSPVSYQRTAAGQDAAS